MQRDQISHLRNLHIGGSAKTAKFLVLLISPLKKESVDNLRRCLFTEVEAVELRYGAPNQFASASKPLNASPACPCAALAQSKPIQQREKSK